MTGLTSLGSNVNSLREFSWETAAFEKDVREKVNWLGSKFSSLRVPPIVRNLLGVMKSYAAENPVTAVFILAVLITSAIPVSIFLGFAIATILVSFLGFLFVEDLSTIKNVLRTTRDKKDKPSRLKLVKNPYKSRQESKVQNNSGYLNLSNKPTRCRRAS